MALVKRYQAHWTIADASRITVGASYSSQWFETFPEAEKELKSMAEDVHHFSTGSITAQYFTTTSDPLYEGFEEIEDESVGLFGIPENPPTEG